MRTLGLTKITDISKALFNNREKNNNNNKHDLTVSMLVCKCVSVRDESFNCRKMQLMCLPLFFRCV